MVRMTETPSTPRGPTRHGLREIPNSDDVHDDRGLVDHKLANQPGAVRRGRRGPDRQRHNRSRERIQLSQHAREFLVHHLVVSANLVPEILHDVSLTAANN
eukprot:4629914-Amphidinium_carterae.1